MKNLFAIILAFLSLNAFGQSNQEVWHNLKTITTASYELKVPSKWRQIPTGEQGPEQVFEASGSLLPMMFNGAPVMVTVFFIKQEGQDLNDCKEKCLNGYKANPDREFPKEFKDGQEKIKLASGQDAYLLNTRFYRKSKDLNQSRYDLVVYSDKAKTGYIYTVSVQYADNEYKFESNNKLADIAKKLYSYLTLTAG
jgi:hypothetical protein